MGYFIKYEADQTLLEEEEKEGLLLPHIQFKEALDEWEQRNIEEAIRWTLSRRRKFEAAELLGQAFICQLHQRMFASVWAWAGKFRTSDKNIGLPHLKIGVELEQLLGDCHYWIKAKIYSPEEITLRFKHRLVAIHCFPNGNGRHSRLMADLLIDKLFGEAVFSWGAKSCACTKELRAQYIKALRLADEGSYQAFIAYARS